MDSPTKAIIQNKITVTFIPKVFCFDAATQSLSDQFRYNFIIDSNYLR